MFKKIYIEITNNCNLNCDFCNMINRDKKFISMDEFKIILSKVEGYTDYLYLHVMGEPLLHPEINELINEASKKYKVNITTNGFLINRLNTTNIRQINISLHSYNKKYHISLDEYLNNIFYKVNEISKSSYVEYRMWVDNDNKNEIIKKLENKYHVIIGNKRSVTLSKNIFYKVEDTFIWPNLNNEYYNEIGSCMGCRSHIGILVDGTVIPCCLDSNGIINLGNIYKDALDSIINSRNFKEIKEGFENNRKINDLCKRCNFYSLRK